MGLIFRKRKNFYMIVSSTIGRNKKCEDSLIRRCIPQDEVQDVLRRCHSLDVGGHFGALKIASKVLQSGFWWPTLFKDAREFVLKCDRCQRIGNLTRKHEICL